MNPAGFSRSKAFSTFNITPVAGMGIGLRNYIIGQAPVFSIGFMLVNKFNSAKIKGAE